MNLIPAKCSTTITVLKLATTVLSSIDTHRLSDHPESILETILMRLSIPFEQLMCVEDSQSKEIILDADNGVLMNFDSTIQGFCFHNANGIITLTLNDFLDAGEGDESAQNYIQLKSNSSAKSRRLDIRHDIVDFWLTLHRFFIYVYLKIASNDLP